MKVISFSQSVPEGKPWAVETVWVLEASLVAHMVKCLSTMRETQVRSLGEDPLEKEMATHSRTTAWKIPWTEATDHGVAESDTTERLHFHSLSFMYR